MRKIWINMGSVPQILINMGSVPQILKDGKKTIAEIYDYIKPLVEDEAKAINVQQSPSISPDAEKIKGRFGLRK